MEKIKLSIIIPAYNVETYIEKCIDSINYSENNIEIIIIDDGSTDNTPNICDMYKMKNQNIKVYHIENGGQARARNIGIDKAVGEYLMFIDSDDYISDSQFIYKILNAIEAAPDMIIYGYKKYWERLDTTVEKRKLNTSNLTFMDLIKTNYFKGCPWDKIIKASIVKDNYIKFPEGMLSEDIDWCAQLIKYINIENAKVINENPYVYVQHKESTSKKVKLSHINDLYKIITKYANDDANDVLLNFLAYEYCMTLGVINSKNCEKVSNNVKEQFYEYKWLMKYDECKKVKYCKIISNVLGIKICAKLLGQFINLKRKGV